MSDSRPTASEIRDAIAVRLTCAAKVEDTGRQLGGADRLRSHEIRAIILEELSGLYLDLARVLRDSDHGAAVEAAQQHAFNLRLAQTLRDQVERAERFSV